VLNEAGERGNVLAPANVSTTNITKGVFTIFPAIPGTVRYLDDPSNTRLFAVTVIVPLALVASFAFPDLSFQVVIVVPFTTGDPVLFGSAPSSHRIHPGAAERGEVNGEGDAIEELPPIVAVTETEYVIPTNPVNVVDVPCTLIGADRSMVHIPPGGAAAANFVPSELDAIVRQFKDADADVGIQSPAPELEFVYIPPPPYVVAANFVPSELDAIENHSKDADADVLIQFPAPELEFVYIPLFTPPNLTTAANFVPSELDAIDDQRKDDADVCVQSPAPELAFVHIPPPNIAAANFVPSELDAIEIQSLSGADVGIQSPAPELAFVYILPASNSVIAANFVPSELDAIDRQFKDADADVCVQDPTPELAFVHIPP
jgi:hypothetical protein